MEQKGLGMTLALDSHTSNDPLTQDWGTQLYEKDPCLAVCFGHKTL